MIEMLLLSALCSRGLPVWEQPNHKSTDARPEGAGSGIYMFTWSDFGSLLARAAKDWHAWIYSSSDLAVNDDCRAGLRATVLAASYKTDPEELARRTTSLLEKLRNFMDPDDSGISARFEEELCRWALTLSIADKRLHPVAYTASDFVSAHPQYARDDDFKTACVFDTQSCHHIILQVAHMSRLRSVFLSVMGRRIRTKVDEELDLFGPGVEKSTILVGVNHLPRHGPSPELAGGWLPGSYRRIERCRTGIYFRSRAWSQ
jgi:hypothetical protein